MDNLNPADIFLGIFYLSAAIFLCFAAYKLMIRKYNRNKLKALNSISLVTSRENHFSVKTKFLLIAPEACQVKIDLLDKDEKIVENLIDMYIDQEEFPFDFDPAKYPKGKYFLYLSTADAKIIRTITID